MAAERPIGGATRLAGVIGWPVGHSRSPLMHNAAFAALGMDWAYVAMPVAPERLEAALRGVAALGFAGVNVTIPHKQETARLCDQLSATAARARSVNTVLVGGDGLLRGETTDGQGMLDAIGELPDGVALVLGAGGAARAAALALRDAGAPVAIAARRDQAAEALAAELGVDAVRWPPASAPALLVNATPVGQAGAASDLPVPEGLLDGVQVVVDLAYRGDGAVTGLVAAARARGIRPVDGLDVLVGQGAIAFRLLTGLPAPVEAMQAAVRRG
ncbi:MAG TPA: shikimate dehydrogenase [Gaiellales bacterium]|nr:shikimate dehydrogenase [Gaiellales bacterium]